MSQLGQDLIKALEEAVAFKEGRGPGILHTYPSAREVRKKAKLKQHEMAPLLGLSLSGYRKVEQSKRPLRGPAAVLLRVLDREPEAVKRALSIAAE